MLWKYDAKKKLYKVKKNIYSTNIYIFSKYDYIYTFFVQWNMTWTSCFHEIHPDMNLTE